MAENDGQVVFDVRADTSRLDDDMASAESKVRKGGSTMAKAAKGAALAIGTAFVSAGTTVMKFGTEFENSMAAASTLIDTSVTDMDALNEKMLTLSDDTNVAASELGNSLYSALSAGISATEDMSEALDFLEQNTKLAKAGFTDIEKAVDVSTTIINAYKMNVNETDRIHKVLIQTQNKGKTTIDELASSIGGVIPIAAAANVSIENLGAAYSNLTAQGQGTAEATTQIKALLNELTTTGSEVDIAFRSATSTVKAASAEQLEAMQDAFENEYEAAQESYEAQEKAYQKSLEVKERDVEGYYDKYIETVEKAHEDELSAFEKAHDEKLKLIDEEYTEKLKLIDEERYNALKAIEDEIDGINAKTAEEEAAIEKAEAEEKRKALKERITNAETAEERKEAEKALADFEAELERKRILKERKERIAELNEKKDAVKEEYDEKAEKLKEETEAAKEAANEVYEAEKEALLDKQELKEKALAAEKQTALDNIREINDAELDAYRKTNQKKLEAASAGSGDGLSFADWMAAGKGDLADAINILEKYAAERNLLLGDIFGSSEAKMAAQQIGGENTDSFKSNLSAMSADEDVVGDAYEKVTSTAQEKFNGVLNTLKNAAVEVFDSIKVKIGELFSEENMTKLNRLITPLKELVEKILPPVLDIVLMLVDPLATLAESLLPVIETAITAIADIIGILAEPLTDIIENVLPVLVELLTVILEPVAELIKTLLPPLLEVLDAVLDPLTELIKQLLPPLTQLLTALMPLFEALVSVISLVAQVVRDNLNNELALVPGIIGAVVDIASVLIDILAKLINFVTGAFSKDWEKVWTALGNKVKDMFLAIPQTIEDIMNKVIDSLNKTIRSINEGMGSLGFEIPEIKRVNFVEQFQMMSLGAVPEYSFGTDYIPEDDYLAKLHKGEAVLTAEDAEVFRLMGGKGALERLASEPVGAGIGSAELSSLLEAIGEGGDTNITQINQSPEALDAYDTYCYLQDVAQQISRR